MVDLWWIFPVRFLWRFFPEENWGRLGNPTKSVRSFSQGWKPMFDDTGGYNINNMVDLTFIHMLYPQKDRKSVSRIIYMLYYNIYICYIYFIYRSYFPICSMLPFLTCLYLDLTNPDVACHRLNGSVPDTPEPSGCVQAMGNLLGNGGWQPQNIHVQI